MKFVEVIRGWLGWCPNTPVIQTAPSVLVVPPTATNPAQPGNGGPVRGSGRIRRGMGIATHSINALFMEKRLFWFSLVSGLTILLLILAERWNLSHIDASSASSYLITLPVSDSYLIVFDLRLFLIETVCLACFTLLLAALVIYRNAKKNTIPVTVRSAFSAASGHAGTLATLSLIMAFVATVLLEISAQDPITGMIVSAITRSMFYLPYAYYFAPNGIFTALFFSFQMMVANTILFLVALYVVPVIVLENKRLLPALAGSVRLMKKTWRELLGCVLVFGAIILVVAAAGLVIGQSPALLNYDYDFFLQVARGQVLMTAACYGFLLACWVLMAVGSTILGIAITDLYAYGRTDGVFPMEEPPLSGVAEPAR
jgi:hypothetical protein